MPPKFKNEISIRTIVNINGEKELKTLSPTLQYTQTYYTLCAGNTIIKRKKAKGLAITATTAAKIKQAGKENIIINVKFSCCSIFIHFRMRHCGITSFGSVFGS